MKIPGLRRKTAKGRAYLYFDTGQRNERGKPILKRLPDPSDPAFGRALARAQAARASRRNVAGMLTVAKLADLWEASPHWRGLSDGSRRNYGTYLRAIRERVGIAPAHDLRRGDVALLRDEMADRPAAANMFVRTLGSLYAWARKRGHVENSPTRDVELLDEGEHEPWPEWLLEKALADQAVQLPVAMLYYTAQRIGDVCAMRWTDIHGGVVHVAQQKTGKTLEIPLHRELAALLAKAPRKGLTILTNSRGGFYRPRGLRERLQAWAAARGAKVVPHGLRKNAVIALLEAGCSVAETSAISGQTLSIVEHYSKQRNQARLGSAAILKWEARC